MKKLALRCDVETYILAVSVADRHNYAWSVLCEGDVVQSVRDNTTLIINRFYCNNCEVLTICVEGVSVSG